MTKAEIINRIGIVKGITHSKEQLEILNHGGGMVVVAGAGSGKTTTITDLIYVLIKSGEVDPSRLLCTTYSKSGANEMNSKFDNTCKKMGDKTYNVTVKTLHAVYYQILSYFGYQLNICSESKINGYIRKCLSEAKLNSKDSELVDYTKQIISYQVNRALSDDDLVNSYVFDLSAMSKEQFAQIRNKFSELKRLDNVVDFDDLQLQLYNLLYMYGDNYSKMIIDYCHSQWDFFIIDEFQDTSMIQYRIFKKMADKSYSNRIVLIGDDDQAIYVWRGTDPNIMLEEVMLDYTLDKLVLPTNYRCKSSIVNFAAMSVRNLSYRENKELKAFNDGGSVEVIGMPDGIGLHAMSLKAKNYIKDLITSGVNPGDIAVLCRNNNQVQILNSMLIQDGIYTDCASENMKFTKSILYSDFMGAIEFSSDTYDYNVVRSNLWKVVPYMNKATSNIIGDIMFGFSISLSEALAYMFVSCNSVLATPKMKEDASKIVNINYKLASRVEYAFSNIRMEVLCSLCDVYNELKDEAIDLATRNLGFIHRCYDSLKFMYSTAERSRYLLGYYKYFVELINKTYGNTDEAEAGKENASEKERVDFKHLIRTIEQLESGMVGVISENVTLSTMHSSKGLEWKYVILFCCDYLSVPNYDYIRNLSKKGYSTEDMINYIDCERRLYYVGCTRAKDKLIIIGDPRRICPFLLESENVAYGNEDCNRNIIRLSIDGYGYSNNVVDRYRKNLVDEGKLVGGIVKHETV